MVKKRILLAEDDQDDQVLFQEYLNSRSDLSIMSIAENGEVLIEQLNRIKDDKDLPSIIILDQNMPKKGGLQTLKFLKEEKRYSHIPVVIYSTYTDNLLIEEGAKAGACLVLAKPLTKEEYNNMMEEMIKTCLKEDERSI